MAKNTEKDLILLADFMSYKGRVADTAKTNEGRLDMLITSASEIFKDLSGGRTLLKTTGMVHKFDGRGQAKLYIPSPPIDEGTTAVKLEYWDGSAWIVAAAGTYNREVDTADGLIMLTNARFHHTRWRVTYDGGYLLTDMPTHFKEAICELVDRAEMKAQGKQGVNSETMNDQSISFDLKNLATDSIKTAARYATVIATR